MSAIELTLVFSTCIFAWLDSTTMSEGLRTMPFWKSGTNFQKLYTIRPIAKLIKYWKYWNKGIYNQINKIWNNYLIHTVEFTAATSLNSSFLGPVLIFNLLKSSSVRSIKDLGVISSSITY